MIHILAELAPLKVSDGSRPVLRASSAQDRALNGVASQKWWPAISKRPALAIPLFDGDFTQDVEAATASFTVRLDGLVNLDSDARGYRWAGAPVSIYAIDTSTALNAAGSYDVASLDAIRAFKGRVEGFNLVGNALTITAEIDKEPFEKDVLALTYAGTGDAEGGQDLKGRLKPWIFGRALNVEPILVNSVDSVVQFSAYPVQGISALYERGASFGPSIGNYPTYAALVAANIPAGKWATCHALGMARLGAPPYGVITGDVDGDNTSGFLRRTGAIIQRIATARGIATALIDTASLNALDAAVPYDINLVLTDQISVLDLARRLARPCNAQAGLDFQGRLFAVRPTIGTPALTLDAQGRQLPPVRQCQEAEVSAPYKRIMFGANRSWRVHTFDEIAFDAELIDRGDYDPAKTYRRGNIVSLPNGSRWLYVSDTPKAGSMPSETNADWELMTGAITAGNITYEDGTPVEELKPAEPGATDGMNDEERDEFDQLAADTATAQTNIAAAQAQIAAIESSVSADFSQVNAALSTLNGEVDTAQSNISSLQSATSAVQQSVSTLQSDVAAAQAAIGGINTNVADLSTQVGAVSADLNDLAVQVGTVGGNVATLSGQVGTISIDVTALTGRVASAEGQISATSSTVATQSSLIQQNAQAITNVEGNLASLNVRVAAGTGPNLLKNGTGEVDTAFWQPGYGTWYTTTSMWGTYFYVLPAGPTGNKYYHLISEKIGFDPGYRATFTCGISVFASGYVETNLRLRFFNGAGTVLQESVGGFVVGGVGFGNDAASRNALKVTDLAPAGTTHVDATVVIYTPNGSSLNGGAFRQAKLEYGAIATPYSADASITQSFVAISTANQSIAQLTTTVSANTASIIQQSTAISTLQGTTASLSSSVSTHDGQISSLQTVTSSQGGTIAQHTTDIATANANISTNATAITAANGNIASLTMRVGTAESSIGTNATAISNLTGRAATLETTVSSQGASIVTLQSATSTLTGDLAALTVQVSAGNPNLVKNGGFENELTDWFFGAYGWGWYATEGNGWGRFAGSTSAFSGQRRAIISPVFSVAAGQQFTAAADTHANWVGNCSVYLSIAWLNGAQGYLSETPGNPRIFPHTFSSDGSGRRALKVTGPAHPNAVYAAVYVVFDASGGGTFSEMNVRQLKAEKGAVATPYTQEASVTQGWTAITTATVNLASLTTRVATAESSVTTNATAISNLNGRTATLETNVAANGASISSLQTVTSTHTGQIAQVSSDLSTANANISQNATAISTVSGNLATLSSTVSSQSAAITNLQTAVSTATSDLATLTTKVTAGTRPNLITNGSAENGLADWIVGYGSWGYAGSGSSVWGGYFYAVSAGSSGEKWYHMVHSRTAFAVGERATASADVDIYGGPGTRAYLQVRFYDAAHAMLAEHTGGNVNGPSSFGGSGRAALTFTTPPAPGGTASVSVVIVAYTPNGSNLSGAAFRQIKLEQGTVATPYSADASITQQWTAFNSLNSSFASLTTRVSSAEGSITTLQTSMTSANGSISTLQVDVSSLNGSVSTLQQSSSTQAGQIGALQTTVTTQGASIASNATAISALTGSVATLSNIVSASSNPNLLPNGGYENGLRGWTAYGSSAGGWFRTVWAWGSYAANATAWTGAGSAVSYLESAPIPVAANNAFTISSECEMAVNGAGAYSYMELSWYNGAAPLSLSSGPAVPAPSSFSSTGATRKKFTATSPANASMVRVRLVTFAPNGVTMTLMSWRQVKLEFGSLATPYSGEATAQQVYTAYSDLNSSFASLSTTVSSQGGSISTLQSSYTSLNGTVSTLSGTVTAQGASITSLQSATSTQAGQISALQTNVSTQSGQISSLQTVTTTHGNTLAQVSTNLSTAHANISQNATAISTLQGQQAALSSTVSSQGASITNLQTATSTLQGNVATLTTQVNAGNPNLLTNGSGEMGLTDWVSGYGSWAVNNSQNVWGQYFYVVNAGSAGEKYYHIRHTPTPFNAGYQATFTFGGDCAADGYATMYSEVRFLNSGGSVLATYNSNSKQAYFGFGDDAQNRVDLKCTTPPAPAGTASVQCTVSMYTANGVNLISGSFRQAKLEVGTVATPYSGEASVVQQFQTLSTLTTQYASLSSTVATQGVIISTQATAITTIQGNVTTLFGRLYFGVDVGGRLSSMTVNNNGIASSIIFNSDLVRFESPDPGTGALEWKDEAIQMRDGAGKLRIFMGYRA